MALKNIVDSENVHVSFISSYIYASVKHFACVFRKSIIIILRGKILYKNIRRPYQLVKFSKF